MHAGPPGNPYPRIIFKLAFVVFIAALFWRICVLAARRMRVQRRNAAQGVTLKPDPKTTIGAFALVALMFCYLLVSAVVDLVRAWPK